MREKGTEESEYTATLFPLFLQKQLKGEQEKVRTDDKGLLSTGDRRGETVSGRVGVRSGLGGGRRGRGGRGNTKGFQSETTEVGHTLRVHHIPHRLSVVSLSDE